MRALLQRVSEAAVRIDGEQTARIGPGLLILLGVAAGDTEADARWTAAKCADLRIFDDAEGLMNDSLLDTGGEALVVSQFTLYGDPRRGRRPSWSNAAAGPEAEAVYLSFCRVLREEGVPVSTGTFGAKMEVHLVNDGPVTLLVESPT